eukprot:g1540.t1
MVEELDLNRDLSDQDFAVPMRPSRPSVWEKLESEDGQFYYYCHTTGETSWTLEEANNIWLKCTNDGEALYYVNQTTGEISNDIPSNPSTNHYLELLQNKYVMHHFTDGKFYFAQVLSHESADEIYIRYVGKHSTFGHACVTIEDLEPMTLEDRKEYLQQREDLRKQNKAEFNNSVDSKKDGMQSHRIEKNPEDFDSYSSSYTSEEDSDITSRQVQFMNDCNVMDNNWKKLQNMTRKDSEIEIGFRQDGFSDDSYTDEEETKIIAYNNKYDWGEHLLTGTKRNLENISNQSDDKIHLLEVHLESANIFKRKNIDLLHKTNAFTVIKIIDDIEEENKSLSNLSFNSSPVEHDKIIKSAVKQDTRSPVWDEKYEFNLKFSNKEPFSLKIGIFDCQVRENIQQCSFIGETTILIEPEIGSKMCPLLDQSGDHSGNIYLSWRFKFSEEESNFNCAWRKLDFRGNPVKINDSVLSKELKNFIEIAKQRRKLETLAAKKYIGQHEIALQKRNLIREMQKHNIEKVQGKSRDTLKSEMLHAASTAKLAHQGWKQIKKERIIAENNVKTAQRKLCRTAASTLQKHQSEIKILHSEVFKTRNWERKSANVILHCLQKVNALGEEKNFENERIADIVERIWSTKDQENKSLNKEKQIKLRIARKFLQSMAQMKRRKERRLWIQRKRWIGLEAAERRRLFQFSEKRRYAEAMLVALNDEPQKEGLMRIPNGKDNDSANLSSSTWQEMAALIIQKALRIMLSRTKATHISSKVSRCKNSLSTLNTKKYHPLIEINEIHTLYKKQLITTKAFVALMQKSKLKLKNMEKGTFDKISMDAKTIEDDDEILVDIIFLQLSGTVSELGSMNMLCRSGVKINLASAIAASASEELFHSQREMYAKKSPVLQQKLKAAKLKVKRALDDEISAAVEWFPIAQQLKRAEQEEKIHQGTFNNLFHKINKLKKEMGGEKRSNQSNQKLMEDLQNLAKVEQKGKSRSRRERKVLLASSGEIRHFYHTACNERKLHEESFASIYKSVKKCEEKMKEMKNNLSKAQIRATDKKNQAAENLFGEIRTAESKNNDIEQLERIEVLANSAQNNYQQSNSLMLKNQGILRRRQIEVQELKEAKSNLENDLAAVAEKLKSKTKFMNQLQSECAFLRTILERLRSEKRIQKKKIVTEEEKLNMLLQNEKTTREEALNISHQYRNKVLVLEKMKLNIIEESKLLDLQRARSLLYRVRCEVASQIAQKFSTAASHIVKMKVNNTAKRISSLKEKHMDAKKLLQLAEQNVQRKKLAVEISVRSTKVTSSLAKSIQVKSKTAKDKKNEIDLMLSELRTQERKAQSERQRRILQKQCLTLIAESEKQVEIFMSLEEKLGKRAKEAYEEQLRKDRVEAALIQAKIEEKEARELVERTLKEIGHLNRMKTAAAAGSFRVSLLAKQIKQVTARHKLSQIASKAAAKCALLAVAEIWPLITEASRVSSELRLKNLESNQTKKAEGFVNLLFPDLEKRSFQAEQKRKERPFREKDERKGKVQTILLHKSSRSCSRSLSRSRSPSRSRSHSPDSGNLNFSSTDDSESEYYFEEKDFQNGIIQNQTKQFIDSYKYGQKDSESEKKNSQFWTKNWDISRWFSKKEWNYCALRKLASIKEMADIDSTIEVIERCRAEEKHMEDSELAALSAHLSATQASQMAAQGTLLPEFETKLQEKCAETQTTLEKKSSESEESSLAFEKSLSVALSAATKLSDNLRTDFKNMSLEKNRQLEVDFKFAMVEINRIKAWALKRSVDLSSRKVEFFEMQGSKQAEFEMLAYKDWQQMRGVKGVSTNKINHLSEKFVKVHEENKIIWKLIAAEKKKKRSFEIEIANAVSAAAEILIKECQFKSKNDVVEEGGEEQGHLERDCALVCQATTVSQESEYRYYLTKANRLHSDWKVKSYEEKAAEVSFLRANGKCKKIEVDKLYKIFERAKRESKRYYKSSNLAAAEAKRHIKLLVVAAKNASWALKRIRDNSKKRAARLTVQIEEMRMSKTSPDALAAVVEDKKDALSFANKMNIDSKDAKRIAKLAENEFERLQEVTKKYEKECIRNRRRKMRQKWVKDKERRKRNAKNAALERRLHDLLGKFRKDREMRVKADEEMLAEDARSKRMKEDMKAKLAAERRHIVAMRKQNEKVEEQARALRVLEDEIQYQNYIRETTKKRENLLKGITLEEHKVVARKKRKNDIERKIGRNWSSNDKGTDDEERKEHHSSGFMHSIKSFFTGESSKSEDSDESDHLGSHHKLSKRNSKKNGNESLIEKCATSDKLSERAEEEEYHSSFLEKTKHAIGDALLKGNIFHDHHHHSANAAELHQPKMKITTKGKKRKKRYQSLDERMKLQKHHSFFGRTKESLSGVLFHPHQSSSLG